MSDTIKIQCPHLANSKHQATLFVWPHKYAGIWECHYGYSDSHNHYEDENAEVVIEEFTEDYHDPGNYYGHGQRTSLGYVCGGDGGCGVTLDGIPEQDIAEQKAEMEMDLQREMEYEPSI